MKNLIYMLLKLMILIILNHFNVLSTIIHVENMFSIGSGSNCAYALRSNYFAIICDTFCQLTKFNPTNGSITNKKLQFAYNFNEIWPHSKVFITDQNHTYFIRENYILMVDLVNNTQFNTAILNIQNFYYSNSNDMEIMNQTLYYIDRRYCCLASIKLPTLLINNTYLVAKIFKNATSLSSFKCQLSFTLAWDIQNEQANIILYNNELMTLNLINVRSQQVYTTILTGSPFMPIYCQDIGLYATNSTIMMICQSVLNNINYTAIYQISYLPFVIESFNISQTCIAYEFATYPNSILFALANRINDSFTYIDLYDYRRPFQKSPLIINSLGNLTHSLFSSNFGDFIMLFDANGLFITTFQSYDGTIFIYGGWFCHPGYSISPNNSTGGLSPCLTCSINPGNPLVSNNNQCNTCGYGALCTNIDCAYYSTNLLQVRNYTTSNNVDAEEDENDKVVSYWEEYISIKNQCSLACLELGSLGIVEQNCLNCLKNTISINPKQNCLNMNFQGLNQRYFKAKDLSNNCNFRLFKSGNLYYINFNTYKAVSSSSSSSNSTKLKCEIALNLFSSNSEFLVYTQAITNPYPLINQMKILSFNNQTNLINSTIISSSNNVYSTTGTFILLQWILENESIYEANMTFVQIPKKNAIMDLYYECVTCMTLQIDDFESNWSLKGQNIFNWVNSGYCLRNDLNINSLSDNTTINSIISQWYECPISSTLEPLNDFCLQEKTLDISTNWLIYDIVFNINYSYPTCIFNFTLNSTQDAIIYFNNAPYESMAIKPYLASEWLVYENAKSDYSYSNVRLSYQIKQDIMIKFYSKYPYSTATRGENIKIVVKMKPGNEVNPLVVVITLNFIIFFMFLLVCICIKIYNKKFKKLNAYQIISKSYYTNYSIIISKSETEKLKKAGFPVSHGITSMISSDTECIICLEHIGLQEYQVFLCGKHFIHKKCFEKWLEFNIKHEKFDICPLRCDIIMISDVIHNDEHTATSFVNLIGNNMNLSQSLKLDMSKLSIKPGYSLKTEIIKIKPKVERIEQSSHSYRELQSNISPVKENNNSMNHENNNATFVFIDDLLKEVARPVENSFRLHQIGDNFDDMSIVVEGEDKHEGYGNNVVKKHHHNRNSHENSTELKITDYNNIDITNSLGDSLSQCIYYPRKTSTLSDLQDRGSCNSNNHMELSNITTKTADMTASDTINKALDEEEFKTNHEKMSITDNSQMNFSGVTEGMLPICRSERL